VPALLAEAMRSRWLAALVGVVVATVLARFLGLGAEPGMFLPYMVAIAAVGLAHGLGPALATIGGSTIASYRWLLAPMVPLVPDPAGFRRVALFRLGVFIAASLALVVVTERHRRALDRLQRSRRQLMAFMSDDGVGLLAVARDGRVLWADSTAMELLGTEPGEQAGGHLSRLVTDARVARAVIHRIGNGQDVENVRAELRRRDGSTTEVLLNANTLLGDAQSPSDGVLLALLPIEPLAGLTTPAAS
jgi:PAS domain-containing protein